MNWIEFNILEEIIVIVINLLGLSLGIWVFIAGYRKILNRLFVVMTASVIFWVDFSFLGFGTDNENLATIFYRLNWGAVSVFLISSFYFYIIYFLKEKKYNIFAKTIFIVGGILFILSVFTNTIIESTAIQNWGAEIKFGYINNIFNLYAFVVGTSVIGILIRRYFHLNKDEKHRIQYFLLGTASFAILNIVFNILSPIFTGTVVFQHFGDYSAILLLAFTAYAIVKRGLFGIRVVLTQVLVTAISVLMLWQAVASKTSIEFTWRSILFILFIIFGFFLVRSVKREIQTREQIQAQSKDLGALFDTIRMTTETLNFREVSQKIVNSIPQKLEHLGFKGGILTIIDDKERTNTAFAITETPIVARAKKLLNKPFGKHSNNIDTTDNLTMKAIKTRNMFTSEKFADFVVPTVSRRAANGIQALVGIKSATSVPIIVHSHVIGVLIFVIGKPVSEITNRDKDIMWTFASQVGIAMENARLFESEKERVEKLKEINRELMKIDQMKSEFLSIASHQLRTPLSGIKGYLSMLQSGDFGDIPKQQQEIVDILSESTNRLIQLVNDFLNVSRIESGRLKVQLVDLQLNDIIEHVIKDFELTAMRKNLKITFKKDPSLPIVKVDHDKITEVISNIVDNAIKYTPKGSITISTEVKKPHVIVKFHDTGIGISSKDVPKLFNKFSRGEDSNKINTSGSGIGLYVVKNLIKAQGGEVWVESPGKGKGSTFFIKVNIAS